MNVLSLFDGLSGGQIALERTGIKVDNYYASEIDKWAIQVAKRNYPNTIHLGSVIDLDEAYLNSLNIDLLIGGSPCQGFSVSGKLKGSATKCGIDITSLEQYLELKEQAFEFEGQSYLFWEYVRVWKIVQPKYFFLENVRVTKKWLPMFNEAMGVEPIMINSALVSAQNRVRFYWTNIQKIEQPEDKGILIRDILENPNANTEKQVLTSSGIKYINKTIQDQSRIKKGLPLKSRWEHCNINTQDKKAYTLTASMHKGVPHNVTIIENRPCELREFKEESLCHHTATATATATDISGNESIKRVYAQSGKSPALTTMQGGHRQPKVLIVPEATKKGYVEIHDGDCFDYSVPGSKTRRGRNMKDKSNCLQTSNGFMRYEHPTYRKLTALECERLQTIPDNYTDCVSDSQRYKMIGNGWTIDVICHIFKNIKEKKSV